jgi:PAS domain S-box-containing protein
MVSERVRRSGTRALGGLNGTRANTHFNCRRAKRRAHEPCALTPELSLEQRENESLRELNEALLVRALRAERTVEASSREAVDAITLGRTLAEEALLRNEALFRAVIEKSAEVMSLTAADGSTRYLTPSAWKLLGWTAEEMGTQTLRDQVVPEDRARIATELARLARTGARDMSMEFRVTHRDGSLRWIESTGTNLLDDPNVRAIVGNYRDITARKRAEEALRESRDLLEDAQAIAHVGSWTSGIEVSERITWSRECYRIFDVPEGTPVTVESFLSCVYPGDLERVIRARRETTEHSAPYDIEHRVQRPDGLTAWVHERAVVERDATGRALRLFGTVQDITDRHVVTDALQDSEERYRRIVENTSEGVWTYDAQGITTFMNGRLASLVGYTV